jgi:hypothetical protein
MITRSVAASVPMMASILIYIYLIRDLSIPVVRATETVVEGETQVIVELF